MLSLDGTLDKNERKKRMLFLLFITSTATFALVAVCTTSSVARGPFAMAAFLVQFVVSVHAMLHVFCKRPLVERLILWTGIGLSVTVLCLDLTARGISESIWPALVLVADFFLVMQVNDRIVSILVVTTICYLVVMAFEDVFRFGIFDLPGLIPQEGALGRKEHLRRMTDCSTPPCPLPATEASEKFLMATTIFVVDLLATRGFARTILKEQAAMERTISVVQEIASLLARYDVEGVAEMLKVQRDELPEEMHATLQRMEENLRKYRPYLPAALFEEEGGAPSASVPPPVLENDTRTIVFTDIRSSTSIWECAPEGMCAALKIHNSVLREVMQVFGGYEVKTIGDAFMVAFASTADGVHFGLKVQERLREANWPASLLEEAPICAEQGPLWGGLTVRIGVNSGPVTVEQNTLTGRTDYFGHTVNVASRLESTCTPGAVAVPSDLWTSVCGLCTAVAGEAEALSFKGVHDTMFVRCLWPASLAGRAHNPLPDGDTLSWNTVPSLASGIGTLSSRTLSEVLTPAVREVTGTVGVVDIEVGDESALKALYTMNAGLATLTIALDQSGGSLVTLLGSCVCVGWNVTRSAPAHMENAVRFAQRMMAKTAYFKGAGVVSGPVHTGTLAATNNAL